MADLCSLHRFIFFWWSPTHCPVKVTLLLFYFLYSIWVISAPQLCSFFLMNAFYIAVLARPVKLNFFYYEKEKCYEICIVSMSISWVSFKNLTWISIYLISSFITRFLHLTCFGMSKSLSRVNRRGQTASISIVISFLCVTAISMIYDQGVILCYLRAVTDSFWGRKYIWIHNLFQCEMVVFYFWVRLLKQVLFYKLV